MISNERIALGVTACLAVLFASLLIVQSRRLDVAQSGLSGLTFQSDQSKEQISLWERKYDAYTFTPSQEENEEWRNRALGCEQGLLYCQSDLKQLQETFTTTTVQHPLEGGATLVEQWSETSRNHFFWLLPKGDDLKEGPQPKHILGAFAAESGPDRKNPVALLFNKGLYRLDVTADYMEAGESSTAWIDPVSLDFLWISRFIPSEDIHIGIPDHLEGIMSPHFLSQDCQQNESAVVDGIKWKGELAYRFPTPLSIRCFFSELGGSDVYYFFESNEKIEVVADLKSISVPLVNGQKVRVTFTANGKPTIKLE